MKKKLARKLIRYYKESVRIISEMDDFHKITKFLRKRRICDGICFCAYEVFDKDVYDNKWVLSHVDKGGGYWCATPGTANNKQDVVKALKNRVKILKTFKKL